MEMSSDTIERIAKLEVAVALLADKTEAIRIAVEQLTLNISQVNRINWPSLLSAAGLIILLYGVAIKPVDTTLTRFDTALVASSTQMQDIQNRQFSIMAQLSAVEQELYILRAEGAPVVQTRLARIESRLGLTNGKK